jgi:DNA mismatch endonuclease (patch repair protein)
MADVHDPGTRSRNMAAIKGKDTKPEVLLRKLLFSKGFRFRIHRKDLPGKPDIVLPRYHAAIFVQGCFWHGHTGCPMFRLPATRRDFWEAKITANQKRDQRSIAALREMGWRVLEVWECAFKGRGRRNHDELSDLVTNWILSDTSFSQIERNPVTST